MLTMTCELKFKDGKTATGSVSVETAYDEREVSYTGELSRLPRKPAKATPGLLRLMFKNMSLETSAEFSFFTEGQYDAAE
jgi:hypothetical protein